MKSRLFNVAAVMSLLLCIATACLWNRSCRAVDTFQGRLNLHSFDICSFAGRLEVEITKTYHAKDNAPDDQSLLNMPRPFELLEEDPTTPLDFSITRGRTPLADSWRWNNNATFFPGFAWSATLTNGRESSNVFDWIRVLQVPYWFGCLLFAVLPTVLLIRRLRAAPVDPGALPCPDCGYDRRASPGRCPECGAVADSVKGAELLNSVDRG